MRPEDYNSLEFNYYKDYNNTWLAPTPQISWKGVNIELVSADKKEPVNNKYKIKHR